MAIITEDIDGDTDKYHAPSSSSSSSELDRLIHHSRDRITAQSLERLLHDHGTTTTLDVAVDLLNIATDLLEGGDTAAIDLRKLERVEALFGLLDGFDDAAVLSLPVQTFSQAVCHVLIIPYTFTLPHFDLTPEISQQLSYWRAGADTVTALLSSVIKHQAIAQIVRDSSDVTASLINTLAKFTSLPLSASAKGKGKEDAWTNAITAAEASEILNLILPPDHEARLNNAKDILLQHLKPIFSATPHVKLHPETGRKLPRALGGDLFEPDYGDGVWKGKSEADAQAGAVGCWRLYQWVLGLLEPGDMENIWHMLVPPLMIMLDDHEPAYRSAGIQSVRMFLEIVPPRLLVRTGLHELILTSISSTFVYTSESANIPMIEGAISAYILYVDRLYPASDSTTPVPPTFLPLTTERHRLKKPIEHPSATRFRLLCSLYQSVVLNLFVYSSTSIPFTTLALLNVPRVVNKMKKGCIRYLGDTLPTVCSILGGSPSARTLGSRLWTEDVLQQLVAAADALRAIIRECEGTDRIDRWRGMILSAAATAWVNAHDGDLKSGTDVAPLVHALKCLMQSVRQDGGSDAETDLQRIVALDAKLFGGLLDTAASC